ncbi:hypothetical protein BH23VER1_BH23VER1_13760 [soil metagenome]
MRPLFIFLSVGIGLMVVGCAGPGGISSSNQSLRRIAGNADGIIRTTAYTHTEADSLQYGMKNAAGTNLKYGRVRSAAADWSVFPMGTVFKIKGEPYLYEVDDYGSALVGTSTIDLYKPNKGMMNQWGVRQVPIEIVRWGDKAKSLQVLKPRTKARHVRDMIRAIESQS